LRELVRTNDAVLISAIELLPNGAPTARITVAQTMSLLTSSICIFPPRTIAGEEPLTATRRLPAAAGLGNELPPDVPQSR